MPPQTAKLPPVIGARVFMPVIMPARRLLVPAGAFRKPVERGRRRMDGGREEERRERGSGG